MDYARGVKGEIDQRPKRFYSEVACDESEEGWVVLLDGRALRSPAGRRLVLPALSLADCLAGEWRAQDERIDLASMFNTRRAYGLADRPAGRRADLIAQAVAYAGTDLVCYLADRPAELRERQERAWGPVRDWAGDAHGVRLNTVSGILPLAQPETSLEAMRRHAGGLDDVRLDGLCAAIGLTGSAVLGLGVERGRLSAPEALDLSRIDEIFQAEQWGEDAEALARAQNLEREARALDLWLQALKDAGAPPARPAEGS